MLKFHIMKNFKIIAAALLASFAMFSCNEDNMLNQDPIAQDENSHLLKNICNQGCPLWAGQSINAGGVWVSNDGTFLYVSAYSENGFQPVKENVKIWVGTSNKFTKRPSTGRFPYKYTVKDNWYHAYMPLAEIEGYNGTCGQKFYIIVHADVLVNKKGRITSETAFGGCEPGLGSAWWYYMEYTFCCDY